MLLLLYSNYFVHFLLFCFLRKAALLRRAGKDRLSKVSTVVSVKALINPLELSSLV